MGKTHIYFFDSYAKFAHCISQHFLFLGLIKALRKTRGLVSLFHPVHYHCNINLSGMDFILSGCISWQCKSIKNALWFSKGTLAPNITKGRSKALVLNKFNRHAGIKGRAIIWVCLYFCINWFFFFVLKRGSMPIRERGAASGKDTSHLKKVQYIFIMRSSNE